MRRFRAFGALSVMVAWLAAGPAPAAPAPTAADSIDALIEAEMARHAIPGLVLAVVRAGETTKLAAYGQANVELGVPTSAATLFPLASTGKSISATAILLLVQDGAIGLDQPIAELLVGLPDPWGGVTVRQLLTHTSGLPDVALEPGRPELIADSWAEALPRLAAMPLAFPPGERWAYNQTNYVLLGQVIERVSGMPFEAFIRERILDPAGMDATVYGDFLDVVPGRATSYEADDGLLRHRSSLVFPRYVRMAAGLNSNAPDMVRWIRALTRGGLLREDLRREMWTAVELADGSTFRLDGATVGYGMGWVVDDRPGRRAVGHSGGNSSAFRYFLDDDVAIVVLHNGRASPDALIDAVAGIVL